MKSLLLFLFLGLAMLSAGCAEPKVASESKGQQASDELSAKSAGSVESPQDDGERPLFYVEGLEALHAARVEDIAVSGGASMEQNALLAGHANAFFENGATWAVDEQASVCVVASAAGWLALQGSTDPHRGAGEKRGLTEQEQGILAALRDGADVARMTGARVYGLPLRRGDACAACHPGSEGALLGAVIYRLVEVADD